MPNRAKKNKPLRLTVGPNAGNRYRPLLRLTDDALDIAAAAAAPDRDPGRGKLNARMRPRRHHAASYKNASRPLRHMPAVGRSAAIHITKTNRPMTDRDAALRTAMMFDAEWHRADAQFHAACEVRDPVPETARQRRAQWMKDYHNRPERRTLRNAQRRSQRRAATAHRKLTTQGDTV